MGDSYVDNLFKLYNGIVPGSADLVCYRFARAMEMIKSNALNRAGLLATQGIRGGANRVVLDKIKESGDMFWAQSDRNWVLDGAMVHVSMIGFDNSEEDVKELDGKIVTSINSDLTSGTDLTSASRLKENAGIAFIGDMKKGKFDITEDLAKEMLNAPINPNGRPNSDVLKQYANAIDITKRPRGVWIIDFGVDMIESDAALYELPFEYVRKNVKPNRDKVRNPLERRKWWIHGRSAPDMRKAIRSLKRFIATPRVAKHRVFVFLTAYIIPSDAIVVLKSKIESLNVGPVCLTGSGSAMFCIIGDGDEEKARQYQNSIEKHTGCKSIIVSKNRW